MTEKNNFIYYEYPKSLTYEEQPNNPHVRNRNKIRKTLTKKQVIELMKKEQKRLRVIPIYGRGFYIQPEDIEHLQEKIDKIKKEWEKITEES